MSEEEKKNETSNTEELEGKIKNVVDELWAEKQAGLVSAVVDEVKGEVKTIVQDALNPEEPLKNEEEEEEGVEKSFTLEDLGPVIAKSVSEAMTDFKTQFFKDMNDNRNPHSEVDLQKQENLLKQKEETPVINKTYNTRETAEILMKKQRSINPVVATALKQL